MYVGPLLFKSVLFRPWFSIADANRCLLISCWCFESFHLLIVYYAMKCNVAFQMLGHWIRKLARMCRCAASHFSTCSTWSCRVYWSRWSHCSASTYPATRARRFPWESRPCCQWPSFWCSYPRTCRQRRTCCHSSVGMWTIHGTSRYEGAKEKFSYIYIYISHMQFDAAILEIELVTLRVNQVRALKSLLNA